MDQLRALAMLAGVLFHAALAYSPLMRPFWPTADASHSVIVDWGVWFLHLFRIPLFFVVAGFFAALLVRRGGLVALCRNRANRILLPLLLFLPLVLISMQALTTHAAATVANPSPVLSLIRDYLKQHPSLPPTISLAHLWFLYYLLLFTVLVWVVRELEVHRWLRWLPGLRPVVLIAWLPALLVPPLASVTVPWPAPESILPALWALLYFGIHFALGYQILERPALLDALRPHMITLLIGAVSMYVVLAWAISKIAAGAPSPLPHAVMATLEAYAGFWLTLCCLLAGRRWLNGHSPVMRWLADASYWVYLLHLPLLFAIQYALLNVPLHWSAKLGLSTLVTFAICLLSYQFLVRHTGIGRLLNGRRRTSGQ